MGSEIDWVYEHYKREWPNHDSNLSNLYKLLILHKENSKHVVVAVDNTLTSKVFLISHLDIIGFVL